MSLNPSSSILVNLSVRRCASLRTESFITGQLAMGAGSWSDCILLMIILSKAQKKSRNLFQSFNFIILFGYASGLVSYRARTFFYPPMKSLVMLTLSINFVKLRSTLLRINIILYFWSYTWQSLDSNDVNDSSWQHKEAKRLGTALAGMRAHVMDCTQ